MYGLQQNMLILKAAWGFLSRLNTPEGHVHAGALLAIAEHEFHHSPDLQVLRSHRSDTGEDQGECFWCGEKIGPAKFLDVTAWAREHFKTEHPDRPQPFLIRERDRCFPRALPWGNDLGASSR